MGLIKDLTGKKFGRLKVLTKTEQRKNGSVVWECVCECGNKILVARNNLEQKNTTSCGCLQAEKVSIRNKKRQTNNLIGKNFGKLTAIRPTNNRDNGYVIWECNCYCGKNNVFVSSHNLISGNTLSCGCLSRDVAREKGVIISKIYKEKLCVNGTRLDIINNAKLRKNNTTGCTGVYLRKKDNRYISQIEFQGKRYFLGSYNKKEEAIKIRLEAQEKLYGEFMKWYNNIK